MNKFVFVNALTLSRGPLVIAGCVCALLVLAVPSPALLAAAVALLAVSAITDLFDGKLARKWNVTSRFGALSDPLMDKFFYVATLPSATFIALYCEDFKHAWLLLAIDIVSMLRDQFVSFLRTVASEFKADVRASFSGKLRTFLGFPIIILVHLYLGLNWLAKRCETFENAALPGWAEPTALALEIGFLALTAVSAVTYTVRFMPYLRKAAAHD